MATAVAFRGMLGVILPLILLPSAAAAIMVTVPLAMPFTRPEASTVAFFSSLLLHVTSFFSASDGSIAAVNCLVSPTARIGREDGGGGVTVIEVTFFAGGVSFSLQEAIRRRLRKAYSKFFAVFLVFMLVFGLKVLS